MSSVRFGRILISLSALLAAMAAAPSVTNGSTPNQNTDSLARLLRSVGHLVTPAAEASVATPAVERPSPRAVLPFTALVSTPFRHALWMISSVSAVDLTARRHQRALLRC
jgi:hypothetical protein